MRKFLLSKVLTQGVFLFLLFYGLKLWYTLIVAKGVSMSRMLYHKGDMYPDSPEELNVMFSEWETCVTDVVLDFTPTIAILPYGRYSVNGVTSYVTLSSIDFTKLSRVVFVGPSHRFVFEGVSILAEESIEMVGESECAVDLEYTFDLKKKFGLSSVTGAHRSLSTETLFPLVRTFADKPFVEIIYGANSETILEDLISSVAKDPSTLLVLSANLSKHHCEREAHSIDRHVMNGILSFSAEEVLKGESKSMGALVALVSSLDHSGYSSELLDYRTSADASEDAPSGRVEGYLGALLGPLKRE